MSNRISASQRAQEVVARMVLFDYSEKELIGEITDAIEAAEKAASAAGSQAAAQFLETHRTMPYPLDHHGTRLEVVTGHTPDNDALAAAIRALAKA